MSVEFASTTIAKIYRVETISPISPTVLVEYPYAASLLTSASNPHVFYTDLAPGRMNISGIIGAFADKGDLEDHIKAVRNLSFAANYGTLTIGTDSYSNCLLMPLFCGPIEFGTIYPASASLDVSTGQGYYCTFTMEVLLPK